MRRLLSPDPLRRLLSPDHRPRLRRRHRRAARPRGHATDGIVFGRRGGDAVVGRPLGRFGREDGEDAPLDQVRRREDGRQPAGLAVDGHLTQHRVRSRRLCAGHEPLNHRRAIRPATRRRQPGQGADIDGVQPRRPRPLPGRLPAQRLVKQRPPDGHGGVVIAGRAAGPDADQPRRRQPHSPVAAGGRAPGGQGRAAGIGAQHVGQQPGQFRADHVAGLWRKGVDLLPLPVQHADDRRRAWPFRAGRAGQRAAVAEGGKGMAQAEQVGREAPLGEGQAGRRVTGGHAQRAGVLQHPRHAHPAEHLRRRGGAAGGQRLAQPQRAEGVAVVGRHVGLAVLQIDLLHIVGQAGGGVALAEGRQGDERPRQRAHRPGRQRRVAGQSEDRPGGHVQNDNGRALGRGIIRQRPGRRAGRPAANRLALAGRGRRHTGRRGLQRQVKRRLHLEAAADEPRRPQQPLQFRAGQPGKGRGDGVAARRRDQAGQRVGGTVRRVRPVARNHRRQHAGRARPRRRGVIERVGRRVSAHSGQQRRLGRRQFGRANAEVEPRRRLDAVGQVAVVGRVERPLQNLLAAEAPFDLPAEKPVLQGRVFRPQMSSHQFGQQRRLRLRHHPRARPLGCRGRQVKRRAVEVGRIGRGQRGADDRRRQVVIGQPARAAEARIGDLVDQHRRAQAVGGGSVVGVEAGGGHGRRVGRGQVAQRLDVGQVADEGQQPGRPAGQRRHRGEDGRQRRQ